MAKLYVPSDTGPYSVDGVEYAVSEDGTIDVENSGHIALLLTLGASHYPISSTVIGERVKSDFGPSQAEHDILRERFVALTVESEDMVREFERLSVGFAALGFVVAEGGNVVDAVLDALAGFVAKGAPEVLLPLDSTDVQEVGDDAPGDTSGASDGGAGDASEGGDASGDADQLDNDPPPGVGDDNSVVILDPQFDEDSDYHAILNWLREHGAAVPGNISKVNALKAVAAVLGSSVEG